MCIAGGCRGAGAGRSWCWCGIAFVGEAGEGEPEFVNRLLTSNLGFVSGFDAGVAGVDGAGVEAAVEEVDADEDGGWPFRPFISACGRPG